MKASARLGVELDDRGHSVISQLRSAAPLALMPARTAGPPVVRLVNSAAAPLGGDDLELTVRVGAGATLTLAGVAATLALPGHRFEPSRFTVRLDLAEQATLDYLPEPTVVTGRARHESRLHATLSAGARLHTREILVLGRTGERPGRLSTAIQVVRDGQPVLRQRLEIGDPVLDASVACLAGRRVLATELHVCDSGPPQSVGDNWWSVTQLATGDWLVSALARDTVTATRWLDLARGGTPARCNLQSQITRQPPFVM